MSSVTIGNSVTEIWFHAFDGCSALTWVYIPSSVTSIGMNLFVRCTSLTTVYYGGNEADREAIEIAIYNDDLRNVTWIYNYTGPSAGSETTPETTTPTYSNWAKSQVTYADENGLTVDSLSNNYTVDITRGQIADLLVNMIETRTGKTLREADLNTFTDANVSSVLKAFEAGIILGKTENTFQPDSTATRQEIAIMIVRAIEKLEELKGKSYIDHSLTSLESYSDFENTANWAKNFVAILANNNIMNGSDNKLNPLSATSIQECLILNNNLFKLGE